MTDKELGRKLAEACGLTTDGYSSAYYSRAQMGSVPFLTLATSLDAIIRNVFPVLKARYPTLRITVRYGVVLGAHSWAEVWADDIPTGDDQVWGHYAESLQGNARALAEACLAALTEVTA